MHVMVITVIIIVINVESPMSTSDLKKESIARSSFSVSGN